MDFRTLLGLGRILRPVLALTGRYRAALWLSLGLAVVWFFAGCAPAAHADTGPDFLTDTDGRTYGPAIAYRPDPAILDGGPGTYFLAFLGTLAICAVVARGGYVLRRDALRDRTDDGLSSSRPGWLRPAGGPFFGKPRDGMGA